MTGIRIGFEIVKRRSIAHSNYASEIRLMQGAPQSGSLRDRQAKRGYCLLWVRSYDQRF